MWNSITSNTASDNKKKEVEDCSCSSVYSVGGSGSSAQIQQKQQQQQQQPQLNVFEHNSNKQSFGGNLTTDITAISSLRDYTEEGLNKYQELNIESNDSGFLSGPVTKDEEDDDLSSPPPSNNENKQRSGSCSGGESNKFNIKSSYNKEEGLDSGCLDADSNYTEEQYEHESYDNNRKLNEQQQYHDLIRAQLSNAAVGDTATAFSKSSSTSTTNSKGSDQMILKNNVDSGVSEWMCNLSLQTDTNTAHSKVAGVNMNNLNTSGRRSATISALSSVAAPPTAPTMSAGSAVNFNQYQHFKPSTETAGIASSFTGTTTASPSGINISNAWKEYYQQNDDGDTWLHLACLSDNADVVAALIRMAPHPCLFNIQNDDAQTPLHLAAHAENPRILRMLLIAGAEPTKRDRYGNTALHIACRSGKEQCVNALIIKISSSEIQEAHRIYGHRSNDKSYLGCAKLPSDLEIRNYDGERCVHLAAEGGHIEILRTLIFHGADINAREGKSGRTPLHIAIESCNEELFNFLLDQRPKLNLHTATYAGLTAYQVACILDRAQMCSIFQSRNAEPLSPPESDYDSSDIETDIEDSKMYDRYGYSGYFAIHNGGNPMAVA